MTQTKTLTIKVDRNICAGHALCQIKAPNVYELDDDGYCSSDGKKVPAGLEKEARLGADVCPEQAITLIEE